ncbi:hypothetical protein C8Q80DRAFT_1122989 [Daedaleopsis nitida]|nr:hypothetical protein C8Q80DRAFT_1122989 [Daedaleopsis nitida]
MFPGYGLWLIIAALFLLLVLVFVLGLQQRVYTAVFLVFVNVCLVLVSCTVNVFVALVKLALLLIVREYNPLPAAAAAAAAADDDDDDDCSGSGSLEDWAADCHVPGAFDAYTDCSALAADCELLCSLDARLDSAPSPVNAHRDTSRILDAQANSSLSLVAADCDVSDSFDAQARRALQSVIDNEVTLVARQDTPCKNLEASLQVTHSSEEEVKDDLRRLETKIDDSEQDAKTHPDIDAQAATIERLRDDLAVAQRTIAADAGLTAIATLTAQRDQAVKARKDATLAHNKRCAGLQNQINLWRGNLDKKYDECREHLKKYHAERVEVSALKKRLDGRHERVSELRAILDRRRKEQATLEAKIVERDAKISELEARPLEPATVEACVTQRDAKIADLETRLLEHTTLKESVAQRDAKIQELETKLLDHATLEASVAQRDAKISDLKARLLEHDTLKASVAQRDAKISDLEKSSETMRVEYSTEIQRLQSNLKHAQRSIAKKTRNIADTKMSLVHLNATSDKDKGQHFAQKKQKKNIVHHSTTYSSRWYTNVRSVKRRVASLIHKMQAYKEASMFARSTAVWFHNDYEMACKTSEERRERIAALEVKVTKDGSRIRDLQKRNVQLLGQRLDLQAKFSELQRSSDIRHAEDVELNRRLDGRLEEAKQRSKKHSRQANAQSELIKQLSSKLDRLSNVEKDLKKCKSKLVLARSEFKWLEVTVPLRQPPPLRIPLTAIIQEQNMRLRTENSNQRRLLKMRMNRIEVQGVELDDAKHASAITESLFLDLTADHETRLAYIEELSAALDQIKNANAISEYLKVVKALLKARFPRMRQATGTSSFDETTTTLQGEIDALQDEGKTQRTVLASARRSMSRLLGSRRGRAC